MGSSQYRPNVPKSEVLVVSGDRVRLLPLIGIAIVSARLSWKSYFTLSLIVVCDKVLLRDGTPSPALLHGSGRESEFVGSFAPPNPPSVNHSMEFVNGRHSRLS